MKHQLTLRVCVAALGLLVAGNSTNAAQKPKKAERSNPQREEEVTRKGVGKERPMAEAAAPEMRQRLREAFAAQRERMMDIQQKQMELRRALLSVAMADEPQREKMRRLIKEISDLEMEKAEVLARSVAKLSRGLTPEQREHWRQRLADGGLMGMLGEGGRLGMGVWRRGALQRPGRDPFSGEDRRAASPPSGKRNIEREEGSRDNAPAPKVERRSAEKDAAWDRPKEKRSDARKPDGEFRREGSQGDKQVEKRRSEEGEGER